MVSLSRTISVVVLVSSLFFSTSIDILYAQQEQRESAEGALGVARMVDLKDKNTKNGTVVSTTETGSVPSNIAYDAQVLGVVARDAAIILSNDNAPNGVPVISNGQVYILVSSKEGPLKKGDLLTTSTIPGVAVKATREGYVLGNALEDYTSNDPKSSGLIVADLDLHYFNAKPSFPGSLSDILKIAIFPTKEAPTPVVKYIVAGAVVLLSFVLTFMTFGRAAAKGVEALGRNPAASRIIHLGIIFNVGICVVITLVGLTVSFLILRL